MPPSWAPAVGPKAPGREDFEHLIAELNAEFERLRQQNLDLTTQLRSRSPATVSFLAPREASHTSEGSFEPERQDVPKEAVAREISVWRSKLGADSLHERQSNCPGASCAPPRPEPTGKREAHPVFQVGTHYTDGKTGTAPRASLRHFHRQASVSISPEFLMSPAASEDKDAAKHRRAREQFRRLDARDEGCLRFADLRRLLERAGETMQLQGLVEVMQAFGEAGPAKELDGGKEAVADGFNNAGSVAGAVADGNEQLGLDFQAFVTLLDESLSTEHLSAGACECVKALRRALQEDAKSFAGPLSQPPKMYAQSTRAGSSGKQKPKEANFYMETIPTVVILLNTLVIGLSADYENYESTWDVLEAVFVGFYTLEFIVKVRLYGCKGYFTGLERWWNLFDFGCLLVSLADVGLKVVVDIILRDPSIMVSSTDGFLMVKIFRLGRLARLVRALRFRFFHELKLMVLGVVSGLRVLTWAIVLLLLLVYVVGVAMTNLFRDDKEFSSVQASMFTLFRCWTEGCVAYDGTPLAENMRQRHGFHFMVFHILMTMFVTVGVFNLIMAIFLDNVVTTQMMRKVKEMGEKSQEIELRLKKLFISYIADGAGHHSRHSEPMYRRVLHEVGANLRASKTTTLSSKSKKDFIIEEWERLRENNATVTRDAFKAWLRDEDFMQLLDEAEIETANHFELFDVLDADSGGELSMDELTTGLMKLRGPVTKADMVAVLLKVCNLTKLIETCVPGVCADEAVQPSNTI